MPIDKKILTMEDANSVLQHFTKGFLDYYYLDTRDLTTEDNLFAYDFIDIYRVEDNIGFKIANEFYTKGFQIKDCNIEGYDVTASGNEINITGSGLEWVVLCLEMSSSFKHNNPIELEYIIEYTGMIRPFFKTHQLSFKCLYGESPVAGKTFTDPSSGTTYTSNNNGEVFLNVNPAKPGERLIELNTTHNGTQTTYKFPFIYVKTKFPLKILNDNIIRDKNNILNFKFLYNTNPFLENDDIFFNGNHIELRAANNTYSLGNYGDSEFSFNLPAVSAEKLDMEVYIEGNDYIERYSEFFEVEANYLTIDDSGDLKTELESDNSAKTILYTGDYFSQQINIDKDVNIIFNGECDTPLENVFNIYNNAKLSISNIIFTGQNLVNIIKGNVALKNSNFIQCEGTIIKGNGNLNIDNCGFIDNTSCININGDATINNSTFELSDDDYVNTALVPFLDVYGNLNFDYCDFRIDLYYLEELGYSYVALKIGGDFQTNGINNNLLKKNDQFKMLNNKGIIHVETDNYTVSSKNNKAMTWNIVNTNTVYNNNVKIEYGG